MANLIGRLLAVLLLASCLPALAQGQAAQAPTDAGPKIGFANLNRILEESETGKAVRTTLERELLPRLTELKKINDNLQAAQAQLDKDGPTLSDSEREQRRRDLVAMSTDLERRKREYDEDYDARQREASAEFSAKVAKVVRKVAVSERYDMMFQEAVWWNPAIDITTKIIKELDASEAAAKSR
jgi:outer membrane protein